MESFVTLAAPTQEPLALADVKQYVRVDFSQDDNILTSLITRARRKAEAVTGRALATQTIQALFTLERPTGGNLSGAVDVPVNWYQFTQQLGANPFGWSPFYFDMYAPPLQAVSLVEYQTTVFTNWVTIPATDGNNNPMYVVDTNPEPGRVWMFAPPLGQRYRFTYTAGYNAARPMPEDLQHWLFQAVAWLYDNRDQPLPDSLLDDLLGRRSWNL